MANPRITIETYLEKIQQGDIRSLKTQLQEIAKTANVSSKQIAKGNITAASSVDLIKSKQAELGRAFTQSTLRVKIATQQIGNWREAWAAGVLVVKDMVSAVGLMNAVMNIAISRFGTMLIIFAAFRFIAQWTAAMRDASEVMDTATRKVQSLVVATTTLDAATKSLVNQQIIAAITVGGTFEQLSDTQFFLISSGLKSAEVYATFESALDLVLATAKDLNASLSENKQIVETLAGLYKNFGPTLEGFNSEQEKSRYMAAVIFSAYRRNQILLTELSAGFTYAAAQAKLMNIPFEEVVVTLAKLNSVMIKGSKAGTSYANALADISKNADKLSEKFDIQLDLDAEGGFSYIEQVLVPLNEKYHEASNSLVFINDLLDVFNKRGARATAGLLPTETIREMREEIELAKHATEELDNATVIAIESYKNQSQINKNLKTVINSMFAIAVTGGHERNNILKATNDLLRSQLGNIALIASRISAVVGVFIALIDLIIQVIRSFVNLAQAANHVRVAIKDIFSFNKSPKESFDKLAAGISSELDDIVKSWENFGSRVSSKIEGFNKLNDIAKNGIENLTEAAKIMAAEEKQRIIIGKNLAKLNEHIIKANNAQLAILGKSADAYDIAGRGLSNYTHQLDALAGKYTRIAAQAKEAGLDFATGFELMAFGPFGNIEIIEEFVEATTQGLNELFAASQRSGFFEEFALGFEVNAKTLPEKLEDVNKKVALQLENMEIQFRDSRREITSIDNKNFTALLEIAREYATKGNTVLLDALIERQKIFQSHYQKQLAEFKQHSSNLVKELRARYKKFTQVTTGENLAELDPQSIAGLDFEDIVIDPDTFGEARAEMERALFDLLHDIDIQRVINIDEAIKLKGVENTKLNKAFADELRRVYENGFDAVEDIGAQALISQQRIAFEGFKASIADLAKEAGLTTDELSTLYQKQAEGVPLLPEEQSLLDNFEDTYGGTSQALVDAFTQRVRLLNKEMERMLNLFFRTGETDMGDNLGVAKDDIQLIGIEFKRTRLALETELGSIADSFDSVGESVVSLVDLMIDENNRMARAMAATVETITSTVSKLIDVYITYQNTMAELKANQLEELGKFAQFSTILAVVSIVAQAASTIANIFKSNKQEPNALQEEILPPDAQARVSPDYGQARVINNRITLTPVFQFLEPSQLSEAMQRRLAEVIHDNLKELEREEG